METGDAFVISVHCEKWTEKDKDFGEPGERLVEIERETVDADTLAKYGRDYAMSEPSCTDPKLTPNIWFNSAYPREDREFFDRGIEKLYSLHIHEVNGHKPEPDDYLRIAGLLNVKFDNPAEPAPGMKG